jgi:hypothetical protein
VNAPAHGVAGFDPEWRRLYRWGGVCALLYILLAIVIPLGLVLAPGYDFELGGAALLEHIAANRTWWFLVQGLVLAPSVLAIVTFGALFVATAHLDRAMASVGALLGITSQVLFLAYFPVVNGLGYLSDQYAAASPARRTALEGGAEALVAMNNAYGPSDTLIAVGVFFFSLAMLRGPFPRPLAYLGLCTLPAAVLGALLKPVLGAAYLWWWVLFVVWFAAVAVELLRLGRARPLSGS